MITVRAVEDPVPSTEGRQWTTQLYQERDAVLQALGVPTFGRTRTRRSPAGGGQEQHAGPPERPVTS